jgi:SlyX protein
MSDELIALQEKVAHQEASIDELTRQLLLQERKIAELIQHVKKLQEQLQSLAENNAGVEIIDAPPPHY